MMMFNLKHSKKALHIKRQAGFYLTDIVSAFHLFNGSLPILYSYGSRQHRVKLLNNSE
jgi:hypothetical protein